MASFFSQAVRVIAIFQSILFISIGHGMLMIILPLTLEEASISRSGIGTVMAGYSLGVLIGSVISQRIFAWLGYFRAFVLVLTTILVCVSIHGMTGNAMVIFLLRIIFGISIIAIFIMVESWLNGLSDALNRGKIFSVYQIFFGLGFSLSPVLYQLGNTHGSNIFFIVVIVMAAGLFPLTMSRLPAPELQEKVKRRKIVSLWRLSPEVFVTVFFAGFILTATITLTALYAVNRFQEGWLLTMILSSYAIGSLLMQFPVGWLADRYRKTVVSQGLMLLGILANAVIYFSHQMDLHELLLMNAFLLAGGAVACMYPLAITQLYDFIELDEALSWVATVQLVYGIGSILGPVSLGLLMDAGGLIMYPVALLVAHLLVSLAVLFMGTQAKHEGDVTPDYQVGIQQATLATHPTAGPIVSGGEDTSHVSDPILKVLIAALKQGLEDPAELMRIMLEDGKYSAGELAVNIVYYCDDKARELLDCLLEIAPEMRIDITRNLLERLIDEEGRLTLFITRALLQNANEEEKERIRELISTHQASVREQLT